jgi:hypothetical protein
VAVLAYVQLRSRLVARRRRKDAELASRHQALAHDVTVRQTAHAIHVEFLILMSADEVGTLIPRDDTDVA